MGQRCNFGFVVGFVVGLGLNGFDHQSLAECIGIAFDQTGFGLVACTVADHTPVEAESQHFVAEYLQLDIAGFAGETACMGVESG